MNESTSLYFEIEPLTLVWTEKNGAVREMNTDRANVLMRQLDSLGTAQIPLESLRSVSRHLSLISLGAVNCYLRNCRGMARWKGVSGGGVRWLTRYGWREFQEHLGLCWDTRTGK